MSATVELAASSPGPSHSDLTLQAERIVHSSSFKGSEILRNLLSYLAHHSTESGTEPVKVRDLATAVFGRSADFDPQSDSIVRVHTGRLRSKLAEYYMTEGAEDDLVITIPKGGYSLVCHHRKTQPPVVEEHVQPLTTPLLSYSEGAPSTAFFSRYKPAISALAFLILGAGAAISYVSYQAKTKSVPPGLHTFWRGFLGKNEPALVVFSNFRLVGSLEGGLRKYAGPNDGHQQIIETYTSVGEVIGVFEITRVMSALQQPVRAKHGALLTWDDAKNSNLIFVGGPLAESPVRDVPIFQEFQFSKRGEQDHSGVILNMHPEKGEASVYSAPPGRPMQFDYALIASTKSFNRSYSSLALAGITEYGTQAAAEFVTQEDQVNRLLSKLHIKAGEAMPQFEALLKVNISGNVPVQSDIVIVRRRQ